MSTQIDYARIVLLNRTSGQFFAANPVLLAGEAAIADVGSRTPSLRFGDGVRPWSSLPSFNALGAPGEGGAATVLTAPVAIPAGPDGTISLTVQGAINNVATQIIGGRGNSGLEVLGAPQDAPGWYYAAIHAQPGTTVRPGTSNGLNLAAGTNADDTTLRVQNAAGAANYLVIRGDGSGYLGQTAANAMFWDAEGHFDVRGTASFPKPRLVELPDVRLAALGAGQTLEWDGANWINSLIPRGTVEELIVGTGLTTPDNPGSIITTHGTIALADTAVTPGEYTQATLTVDAQGRITAAASGIVPVQSLAGLADVSLTNQAQGDVLAWDSNREAWVNSDLPGGAVIALHTLQDVNITSPGPSGYELLRANPITGIWENGGSAAINSDANQDALMLNAAYDHKGLSVYRPNDGVFVYGRDNNSGAQFALRSQFADWFSLDIENVQHGFTVTMQGRQTLTIAPNGCITVNEPLIDNYGNALTILGPHGTYNWGEVIGSPADGSGLNVNAGSTSAEFSFLVQSYNGVDSFQVKGDGSGVLGSYGGRLRWDASGYWELGNILVVNYGAQNVLQTFNNNSATSLRIQGLQNYETLWVAAGPATNLGVYTAIFYNNNSNVGCSNGLFIRAGSASGDSTIYCDNYAGTSPLLRLRGDGALYLPLTPAGGGNAVYMTGGYLQQATSSIRFKQNVRSMCRARARQIIAQLRAVSYNSKCEFDDPTQTHYGLIAEEVAAVDSGLVTYDGDGKPRSVHYEHVAMLLLPLVQELLGLDELEGVSYG